MIVLEFTAALSFNGDAFKCWTIQGVQMSSQYLSVCLDLRIDFNFKIFSVLHIHIALHYHTVDIVFKPHTLHDSETVEKWHFQNEKPGLNLSRS